MRIIDSRPLAVRESEAYSIAVSTDPNDISRWGRNSRRWARLMAALRRRAALAAWDRAVEHFRRPQWQSYNREIEADSLTALAEVGVERPATTESVAYGF